MMMMVIVIRHLIVVGRCAAMSRFRVNFSSFDEMIVLGKNLFDDVFRIEHQKSKAPTTSGQWVLFNRTIDDRAKFSEVFP